jgi:poly(hydroxyalkanoate) granule-associated protein
MMAHTAGSNMILGGVRMAKVEVVVEDVQDAPDETEEQALRETAHTLYLASIGAAAMAQDKIAACLARFIERGEAVELEGRQLVRDKMAKRKHQVRKLTKKQDEAVVDADVDAELEAEVQGLLDRMNVPTKTDIDALGAQVADLTEKVDSLKKA